MNLKQCSIVGELDKITNTAELNKRFYTKEGDIIISQMGTVGDVGVVKRKFRLRAESERLITRLK